MDKLDTQLVVLGGGPAGYTAAFYASDKGMRVLLVDQDKRLGGVCLNRGCIPSKALLNITHRMTEVKEFAAKGIGYAPPSIALEKVRAWKDSVLQKLGQGLSGLAQKRNVTVLCGRGRFEDSRTLKVQSADGAKLVAFEKAIIATGSRPAMPRALDVKDKRIMTSTEALELEEIPKDLLVIGGGYIGLELGTVYAALGSRVVLAEALGTILTGVDQDLVRPLMRYAQKNFRAVHLNTKVSKMALSGKKVSAVLEGGGQKKEESFDRVLVSVGRVPNGEDLGLEKTKVTQDAKGFIKVNPMQQTADPAIYAIGDVVGGALLAHKASKEAKIAVEVLKGETSIVEDIVMPAVVFTDPEIAWCGLTEEEAKQKGIAVEIARFPWSASGRAASVDRPDGITKLILEPGTDRVLGVGIAGTGASELISEGVLAIEMGATARDLAQTVHPHPTLSETLMECAEAFYGHSTHAFSRVKILKT